MSNGFDYDVANDEHECDQFKFAKGATLDVNSLQQVGDDVATSDSDEDEIDSLVAAAVTGLGPPGGGWGGAAAPVNRARDIGVRNGLTVTSRKRSSGCTGSDHHISQARSDAVDLSNGSSPTPQMDRTAAKIAALLGVNNWTGGNLRVTVRGYRVQLLYKTNIGGNHFNHVHVGIRMV